MSALRASGAPPPAGGLDPRLWLLLSPALPVGGYSYSQGLEYAVAAGWVHDPASARGWILGIAETLLPRLDLPLLKRLYEADARGDAAALARWNAVLLASRESAELHREDVSMGAALRRLLAELEGDAAIAGLPAEPAFATAFARACRNWRIDVAAACTGYAWVWADNQVAAAIKLVPLGQSDGQRLLLELTGSLPDMTELALSLDDEAVGITAPGLGLASAAHETQYTRLFRS